MSQPDTHVGTDIGRRFGLGPMDQISFVVADVEEAVSRYTAMFGGPFDVMDVPMEVVYRGEPTSVELRLAFCGAGPVEVELVQPLSGDSPAREFLESHGEGLHHVRFPVSDMESARAEMEAEGFETIFSGGSHGVSFAYLEAPLLGGMVVELLSMPEQTPE